MSLKKPLEPELQREASLIGALPRKEEKSKQQQIKQELPRDGEGGEVAEGGVSRSGGNVTRDGVQIPAPQKRGPQKGSTSKRGVLRARTQRGVGEACKSQRGVSRARTQMCLSEKGANLETVDKAVCLEAASSGSEGMQKRKGRPKSNSQRGVSRWRTEMCLSSRTCLSLSEAGSSVSDVTAGPQITNL
jgi:hypothetical protein